MSNKCLLFSTVLDFISFYCVYLSCNVLCNTELVCRIFVIVILELGADVVSKV
jgi:hypothetical protein